MGRESRERRALNIVWAAAGDYAFMPDFLAFHASGEPDLYLNAIIGLVHKLYDEAQLAAFTRELDNAWFAHMFHDLFWLGLEHAAYHRAVAGFPPLRSLRHLHAHAYLDQQANMQFIQEQLMHGDLAHSLQAERCRRLLRERPLLVNPWERNLYEALRFDGDWSTAQLIAHARETFRRFFVFRFGVGKAAMPWRVSVGDWFFQLFRRFLSLERGESFQPRLGAIKSDDSPDRALNKLGGSRSDLAKVEALYPKSLWSPAARLRMEELLCTGPHRDAHVYYAQPAADGEQRGKNAAYLQQHALVYRTATRQLTRSLKNTLAVWRQPLPLPAKSGQLDARRVYRAVRLNDPRIFTQQEIVPHSDFAVTLLLDASYSRAEQASVIAAQALTIARALAACGIPLQVLAFCSLHGYTVVQQMKSFAEPDLRRLLDYRPNGWNRDGLALRLVARLLPPRAASTSMLLMLTDARPTDDHALRDGSLKGHDYSGALALDDTASEVKRLKAAGVKVVGVIHSDLADAADAARRVFGHDFAKIERLDQLAPAVSQLVALQIRS